jgi:hypothetical protein
MGGILSMAAGQGNGRKQCRPFAAGALIALAGPLLGSIPLLMLFQYAGSAQPYASAYGVIKSFPTAISTGYFWGALPAIIAGGVVAQGILSNGWVSLRYWLWLTVLLAALLPLVFLFGGFSERGVPLDAFAAISIALFFLASALFASLVLRTAIIRLGWMKPPSQTETVAA